MPEKTEILKYTSYIEFMHLKWTRQENLNFIPKCNSLRWPICIATQQMLTAGRLEFFLKFLGPENQSFWLLLANFDCWEARKLW